MRAVEVFYGSMDKGDNSVAEVTAKREKASDFGAGTTLVTGALAETARLSGQDTGVRKALQSNVTLVLCDMPSREKILE